MTTRGVNRQRIFQTDADRRFFLSSLLSALKESRADLFAYCLMDNHVHLLVACRETPLGETLHRALTTYAMRFNAQNGRTGHLFQARYHSRPVHDPAHLHAAVAYIHANPVRARMTRRVSDWAWSSHSDWSGQELGAIDLVRLSELTATPAYALREEYARRVPILEYPAPQGLDLQALIEDTAGMLCLSAQDIVRGRKGGLYTLAKRLIAERARLEGHSQRHLAQALRCTTEALIMMDKRTRTPP